MFKPIKTESNPPENPTFVWDGECGFCKYWITVWKRKTGDNLKYEIYQDVYDRFASIPLKEFKKASRLIEPNGNVYSGPDSAYRSFIYFHSSIKFTHKWYHKYTVFKSLSDGTYNWIAKHRSIMFTLTKLMRGSNPEHYKPFWLAWLLFLILTIWGTLKI